jgi:archaeal flagellar protein FlaH
VEDKAKNTEVIVSGVRELDEKLGGGIPFGSLCIIEGHSDAGKSVLSQHLAYGAMNETQCSVAYYTSENTIKSMIAQMDSLSLFTLDHFLTDRFRIYPIQLGSNVHNNNAVYTRLTDHISSLPKRFQMVVIDSVTLMIAYSDPVAVVDFFSSCKQQCDVGRSIFLVAHSYAFNDEILPRTSALCDAHLKLRLEQVGDRLVKMLEVLKVRGAERRTGEVVSFEIEPKTGIRIVPLAKARV